MNESTSNDARARTNQVLAEQTDVTSNQVPWEADRRDINESSSTDVTAETKQVPGKQTDVTTK